jgi:hypothetical protein
MKMDDAIYSPILLAKPGEFDAVTRISEPTHRVCRPLFDIPPPKSNATIALHTASAVAGIANAWGTRRPCYLDFSQLGSEHVVSGNQHAAEYLYLVARQKKLRAIPVTGPRDLRADAHIRAISSAGLYAKLGAAARLLFEDWRNDLRLVELIRDCAEAIAVPLTELDLILDAGAIEQLSPEFRSEPLLRATVYDAVSAALTTPVRRIVFAASSVPKKIEKSENGRPTIVRRVEYLVWKDIASRLGDSRFVFGDYAVTHATFTEPGGAVRAPSRVRLCTSDEFHLFKTGRRSHRSLCSYAAKSPAFQSQYKCWGVDAIRDCGLGSGGAGGPTDWVARDTNAHVESTAQDVLAYSLKIPAFKSMHYSEISPTYARQASLIDVQD